MSKLVDGIKDRMVAAAREAAPPWWTPRRRPRPAAAEKVAEQLPDARTRQGRRPSASEPATAAEPVAAATPRRRDLQPRERSPANLPPGHRRGLHHR